MALNPNGKVPLLVVDGTPLFEALAIFHWLGDRFGVERRLWPAADAPARLEALSWTTWGYVTFGNAVVRWFHAQAERSPKEMHNAAVAAATRGELQHLLGLLDARLKNRPYLIGAQFSLVDLVLACEINYGKFSGVPIDGFAALGAWHERCLSRPSLQAPWE